MVGTRSAVFAPLENRRPAHRGRRAGVQLQAGGNAALQRPGRGRGAGENGRRGRAAGSATPSLGKLPSRARGKANTNSCACDLAWRIARWRACEIVDLREDFRQTHQAGPISRALARGHWRRALCGGHAIVCADQSARLFLVCAMPELWGQRSLRKLQHRAHLSQAARPPACHYCGFSRRVPRGLPEMRFGARLFCRRRRRASWRSTCARCSLSAHRAARSGFRRAQAQPSSRCSARSATGRLTSWWARRWSPRDTISSGVTLVGVVSADAQLGFPDFRAAERTFQLLTQVAGRAGRGTLAGEVLVETHYPEHYAIQLAAQQDYLARFSRRSCTSAGLCTIRLSARWRAFAGARHESGTRHSLVAADRRVSRTAWRPAEIKVLGPAAAPLARIKREYRFHFLLKSPRRSALNQLLNQCLAFAGRKGFRIGPFSGRGSR